MSSTTTTVSMNARRRSGKRGPTSASRPSAKAVSVDIAIPQPPADERPAVEREVDRDGHRHPADPRQQRQGEPPPLPQLAQVELASRLEADDEEEERHQPAVDPVAKVAARPPSRPGRSTASCPRASRTTMHRRSPRRAPRRPPPARPPRRRSPCAGTPAAASSGVRAHAVRPEVLMVRSPLERPFFSKDHGACLFGQVRPPGRARIAGSDDFTRRAPST